MDKLDRQAWDYYIDTRCLTIQEQMDADLCVKLRASFDFGLCRLYIAWRNLGKEIMRVRFKIKK